MISPRIVELVGKQVRLICPNFVWDLTGATVASMCMLAETLPAGTLALLVMVAVVLVFWLARRIPIASTSTNSRRSCVCQQSPAQHSPPKAPSATDCGMNPSTKSELATVRIDDDGVYIPHGSSVNVEVRTSVRSSD